MNRQTLNQVVERVKMLVFRPRAAWETIRDEEHSRKDLMYYLAMLAVVPAAASFLGMWLVGYWISVKPIFRLSFGRSLSYALIGYGLTVCGVWLIGKAIGFLAPRFGAETDELKALKLAVFSATPYLAAGILNLFPPLGTVIFIAGFYSLYLIYLGLPIVMDVPKERSFSLTVTILISVICIYLVIGWITSLILMPVLVI
ncbi:MAG TPA: DUF1282 domain-containing protein [bacterium]|nr:DUF1282 domain-containing protein [bacterium]